MPTISLCVNRSLSDNADMPRNMLLNVFVVVISAVCVAMIYPPLHNIILTCARFDYSTGAR